MWPLHGLIIRPPIGKYETMLFLWNVLFGTARITRQYPPAYGLKDDRRHGSEKWVGAPAKC